MYIHARGAACAGAACAAAAEAVAAGSETGRWLLTEEPTLSETLYAGNVEILPRGCN